MTASQNHMRRITWWRHQMEAFSALLAICVGNSPVTGGFPTQRPVTRSFDVFFYLRQVKRLSKRWWGWWFETPSYPLAIWKWTQVSNFDWYREKLRLGRKYLITIMMQELLIERSHEFHFIWLAPNEKEHVCILALQMESFSSEIFTLHQSTVILLIQYYAPYDMSTSFIIHIYFLNLRTPLSSDWATSQPATDDVTHITWWFETPSRSL